jgi:hypothetical protein
MGNLYFEDGYSIGFIMIFLLPFFFAPKKL